MISLVKFLWLPCVVAMCLLSEIPLSDLTEEGIREQLSNGQAVQPQITTQELLAALRRAGEEDASGVRSGQLAKFASSGKLPSGSRIEVEVLQDLGGKFVYEVENAYLCIPDEGKPNPVRIVLRNRTIQSRTIAEEIQRLEAGIVRNLPGSYRIRNRIEELRQRAALAATNQKNDPE